MMKTQMKEMRSLSSFPLDTSEHLTTTTTTTIMLTALPQLNTNPILMKTWMRTSSKHPLLLHQA